jgi:hypothetical protein
MSLVLAAALLGQVYLQPNPKLVDRYIEQSYGINNPRPHTISLMRGPQDWPGYNGVVTKIDTKAKLIYTDLAVESVAFRYTEKTRFRTLSGRFHRLAPGDQINVDSGTVTIVD